MPIKRVSLSEYEEASGLQRGQLWDCLTQEEQTRLIELGYRPKCKLTQGALDYLMEVFPLPDHLTELLSFSRYEEKIGFSRGLLWDIFTPEQKEQLCLLGLRKYQKMPFRVMVYLKKIGIY